MPSIDNVLISPTMDKSSELQKHALSIKGIIETCAAERPVQFKHLNFMGIFYAAS